MNRLARAVPAIVLVALTACGGGAGATKNNGSVIAAGSTALLPLVKQAAADYAVLHPDVDVNVSGGGSRVGITQAAQKGVDIGDSDIPAVNEPTLIDHKVAVVSFAVVANPGVGVTSLTTAQIRAIFSGAVTNWKQVGGVDQEVTIINRPRSSGTRATFVAKVLGGKQPMESGTQDSSGTVAEIVNATPGAVSYVSTSYVRNGNVIAIAIDGVRPTIANVTTGKYPYWSYEHMFTNGMPSKHIAAFITFVETDANALRKLGFIPVSAMKVK